MYFTTILQQCFSTINPNAARLFFFPNFNNDNNSTNFQFVLSVLSIRCNFQLKFNHFAKALPLSISLSLPGTNKIENVNIIFSIITLFCSWLHGKIITFSCWSYLRLAEVRNATEINRFPSNKLLHFNTIKQSSKLIQPNWSFLLISLLPTTSFTRILLKMLHFLIVFNHWNGNYLKMT